MKKVISIILSIIMLLSITTGMNFSVYALDSSGSCGDNVYWSFNSSTGVLTISGSGPMTDYGDYDGYKLFEDNDGSIKHVIIENGVTRIGANVFSGCSYLTSVTISKSVLSIGEGAFKGCYNLSKVYIEDISIWCNTVFSDSESNPLLHAQKLYLNNKIVTDLTLPNDVNEVKSWAFIGCTSLRFLKIPNSVTKIGYGAFSKCTSLEKITLSGSVKEIGSCAFYECDFISTISIPKGVERIGSCAFGECDSLKRVNISDTIKSIGAWAFDCNKLEYINIESVESWCNVDFAEPNANPLGASGAINPKLYCNNELIEYLIIPQGVEEIKPYAFCCNKSLHTVIVPKSVKRIGQQAFYNCENLKYVFLCNGLEEIDNEAFLFAPIKAVGFDGTQEQWRKIYIGKENEAIVDAYNEYNYHYFTAKTTKQPTFKSKGVKTYTCILCGKTKTTTITKLRAAKLSKVKAGKKKFIATWVAINGVGGYEIQYSHKKNMKSAKKKTIKGATKAKLTVKKLKSNKTYYVRIRAYKVINGTKVYSKWSAKKKVKIK